MNEDKKLIHMIIRVPKEESAFTYFTLEANEGISFYSTLNHEVGQSYRDIDLKSSKSLEKELLQIINKLQEQFSLEILLNEEIDDK